LGFFFRPSQPSQPSSLHPSSTCPHPTTTNPQLHKKHSNLPNTPPGIFEGKQRTCFVAVQGRFKRPVRGDALIVGADFQEELRLPPKMFLMVRLGDGW
jgi:hypothetical protein